jgi:hypothetical protein
VAGRAVARCFVESLRLLGGRQVRWPRSNVGRWVRFADGSAAWVYRETVVPRAADGPCYLSVSFRLRWVRGRGHDLFRRESVLNTPLFVGFPGFIAKLWLASDAEGVYRGLYEWDGVERAERYARSLWRVLELVSEPGSIDYRVVPGLRLAEVLVAGSVLAPYAETDDADWWRVVAA